MFWSWLGKELWVITWCHDVLSLMPLLSRRGYRTLKSSLPPELERGYYLSVFCLGWTTEATREIVQCPYQGARICVRWSIRRAACSYWFLRSKPLFDYSTKYKKDNTQNEVLIHDWAKCVKTQHGGNKNINFSRNWRNPENSRLS